MKKITVRIVSVLTFVILFASILSTPAFAISTYCVQNHFSMLCFDADGDGDDEYEDEIRTPPSENTCPYVAMSLLLTFYDSYWNDDFVADEYEWEPGTYNRTTDTLIETFAATTEAKDWETHIATLNLPLNAETYPYYRAYAAAKEGNFLEPYLISIGKSLLFHLDPNDTLGLNDLETVAVLQTYLYIYRGFNINQVTVNYLHEDNGDIEAKMREVIDDGYPLIYIGKKLNSTTTTNTDNEGQTKSGHELIAYGIDEDDNIMLHTGWDGEEFCTYEGGSNPTDYNLNRAIIWLELKGNFLTHTHTENSGNYVDSITGEELCACQIYSRHPNHNSNHLYKNGADSDSHFLECHCGARTNVEAHNLTYIYYSSTQHYEICNECTYARTMNHEYTTPCSPTATGHSLMCACGETTTESHYDHRYTSANSSYHKIYCKCGYLIGSEAHQMVSTGLGGICTHCDYTSKEIPGPGQIILGEDDEEPTTE